MADDTQGTEQTEAATDEGQQALDAALDALTGPENEEADSTETEADDADEAAATPADDNADETPETPTAESLGLDLKSPKDKAAYDELVRTWTRWSNKFHAKHGKQKPDAAAPTRTEDQPAAPTVQPTGDAFDPYSIPLDTFTYKGSPEPEGSDLAGFEDAIDKRIDKGVKEGIKFALDQMRVNDGRLREQAQVGSAQQQIAKYAEALQSHPDWEEKAALVAKIASGTRDLAINDPEEWISMVEARTGISRSWREGAAEGAAAANSERAQQHKRLATKSVANLARPTNGNRVATLPNGRTDMDPAEAAEHNYRRVFGH